MLMHRSQAISSLRSNSLEKVMAAVPVQCTWVFALLGSIDIGEIVEERVMFKLLLE